MATVNLDLYVLWKSDRFVTSLTNPSQPSLPTITPGDTWNCNCYFVDGSPMQVVNLADVDVSARFRAAGNNHGYGDSSAQTRIGPANNAIAITRTRAGVKADTSEIQRIVLPASPTGGSYVLNFPGPTVLNAPSAVAAPKGSITVQSNWTITQIRDAIRALPFYEVFNATLFDAPGYGQYVTLTGTPTDYSIDYGNGSNRKGPIELCTYSANLLQFLYGWNVVVPLTASDFSDLFLSANGPSFFEVMLNGQQAAFIQLTAAPGGGGGNVPAFENGPPPNNGSVAMPYSFAYSASGFPIPTFTVSAGAMPPGLSLSAAGGISGTPTTVGTYTGVVTITNSNGTANQAFSITIVAGGGGGVFYVGDIIFDGSYNDPFPIGPPEISHGIPDDATSLIWRQKYHQRETAWSALPLGGMSCPYNASAVAVDETPLRWTTVGDIMEFERTWALIPSSRRRPGSYAKTYKSQQYLVQNGQIDPTTFSITSRTALIAADFFYDYFNIVTQGIPVPVIMDIAVVHNGPFHSYELYGGFPPGTTTQFGNNYAYCLIGVDTRQYMGPIWERFLVYGQ